MSKLLISKRQTFIFGKLTYRRSGDGADDKTGPLTSPHFQLVTASREEMKMFLFFFLSSWLDCWKVFLQNERRNPVTGSAAAANSVIFNRIL